MKVLKRKVEFIPVISNDKSFPLNTVFVFAIVRVNNFLKRMWPQKLKIEIE